MLCPWDEDTRRTDQKKEEGGLKGGWAEEEGEKLFFLSKRSQKGSGSKKGEKWCDWREPNQGAFQARTSLGPVVGRKAVGTELEEPCVAHLEGWKGGRSRKQGLLLLLESSWAGKEGPTVTS